MGIKLWWVRGWCFSCALTIESHVIRPAHGILQIPRPQQPWYHFVDLSKALEDVNVLRAVSEPLEILALRPQVDLAGVEPRRP